MLLFNRRRRAKEFHQTVELNVLSSLVANNLTRRMKMYALHLLPCLQPTREMQSGCPEFFFQEVLDFLRYPRDRYT